MMLWSDRSEKRIEAAAAAAAAAASVKAKAEGIEEGRREGKAELAQKVIAWNIRRIEAEKRDEPFNEPPPTE